MTIDITRIVERYIEQGATPTERTRLLRICEVGAMKMAGKSRYQIASALGLGVPYIGRLLRQWRMLSDGGADVAKAVIDAVRAASNDVVIVSGKSTTVSTGGSGGRISGFAFTSADEEAAAKAMRESAKFMEKYGRGQQPLNGMVHRPDERRDKDKWLPAAAAASYCGLSSPMVAKAGKDGIIRRRPYARSGGHNLYEYLVSDLDKLINGQYEISSPMVAAKTRQSKKRATGDA